MAIELKPLGAYWTKEDLVRLTEQMIGLMEEAISEATDADVVFVPSDPGANDTFASDASEVGLAWTLGHVIVHTTASAEESAFLAAELARGVEREGRSRSEVPWETVTTIQQCRERLAESRRMRLASLELWPEPPHLDTLYRYANSNRTANAWQRFTGGLNHDNSHIDQIREIVRQAKEARSAEVAS